MKYIIVLALSLLVGSANATDVWSGEFHATTLDSKEIGFVATFPADKADCIKGVIRDVASKIEYDEYLADLPTYAAISSRFASMECDLTPADIP